MSQTIPDIMITDMKDSVGNLIAPMDVSKFTELGTDDLEKLVKAISDSQVNAIIAKVEAVTDRDYSSLEFSIFDYIGFDPFMVSKVFKAYQDYYKDSDTNLLSDVKFSIAACLYMGNLQVKAFTRRALEGRSKIEYLSRKYGIRTGSQGTGIPATALTFPRIAAAYPVLAIRMASHLSPKAVNLDFLSALSPPYTRLTPFGSLCSAHMDRDLRQFLLEACNAHGSDMAIAFEKGRLKKAKREIRYDPIAIAHDQWAFMEVASTSPVPSESARKSLLTQLNLVKDYKNLSEIVVNYRAIVQKTPKEQVTVMTAQSFADKLGEYLSSNE